MFEYFMICLGVDRMKKFVSMVEEEIGREDELWVLEEGGEVDEMEYKYFLLVYEGVFGLVEFGGGKGVFLERECRRYVGMSMIG